ncbi:hypothetical protein EFQ99_20040 [Rhizobium vallis]|uniref:Uncharacterized protein n=1 Tax=Rhizobium vallis TaxID=634290 RepID=A0A432PHH0_9HYPH|nr:hypothetical protein EFQ99_20040 [Rhizobium vallis]
MRSGSSWPPTAHAGTGPSEHILHGCLPSAKIPQGRSNLAAGFSLKKTSQPLRNSLNRNRFKDKLCSNSKCCSVLCAS